MGEHTEKVIRQAKLLLAEKWADGITNIHIFDTTKTQMWYENINTEKDGRVTDITYNDGRIERSKDGKVIRTFGEKQLHGDDLINQWERFGPTVDISL
tara:strand:+ start:364 stop:657 length:294 start_codon:yes stop_codon:yes gene_type:complete